MTSLFPQRSLIVKSANGTNSVPGSTGATWDSGPEHL